MFQGPHQTHGKLTSGHQRRHLTQSDVEGHFDFSGSRGGEVKLASTLVEIPFDDWRTGSDDFARIKPALPFGGAAPVGGFRTRGSCSDKRDTAAHRIVLLFSGSSKQGFHMP